MTVHFRLALAAAFVLLAPSLVSAQVWPSEIRRKFVDECLASCTANPKFSAVERAECAPYCECMVRESQGFMSADDYTVLLQAYAEKKTTPMRERYEALSSTCGHRALR